MAKTVAISLGGGGVLTAAIIGVILWLSQDMRDVTHTFLGLVRARRSDVAFTMTSARLQASMPPASFAAWVDGRAPFVRASTSEWINGFGGGGDEQCMDVWLDVPGHAIHENVYLMLHKENGQWRIDDVTNREPSMCASD